jgi:putative sigma-54 modulation protein
MKLDIQSVHFDADQKLLDFIQKKTDKLEKYHDKIIAGEVILKLDTSAANENKIAEINLDVPGHNLFAKRQCKSFEEATDEALEALRRQIVKSKEKMRAY